MAQVEAHDESITKNTHTRTKQFEYRMMPNFFLFLSNGHET